MIFIQGYDSLALWQLTLTHLFRCIILITLISHCDNITTMHWVTESATTRVYVGLYVYDMSEIDSVVERCGSDSGATELWSWRWRRRDADRHPLEPLVMLGIMRPNTPVLCYAPVAAPLVGHKHVVCQSMDCIVQLEVYDTVCLQSNVNESLLSLHVAVSFCITF